VAALTASAGLERRLLDWVDLVRLGVSSKLAPDRQTALGQFFTPAPTARLMASMLDANASNVRLIDPGAGIGTLTAAGVAELCSRSQRPGKISVAAYEIDTNLIPHLRKTLDGCRRTCELAGIQFECEIVEVDFIEAGAAMLRQDLFAPPRTWFNCALLNPPYRKINSDSRTRRLLRAVGIETTNLYTAFLAIVAMLLSPEGELVAITPRSFCNGPYFRPFRVSFLETMTLRHIHVFDSRDSTFRDDRVLQENIIVHAIKGGSRGRQITVSSSESADVSSRQSRLVAYDHVVRPDDPHRFIHIVPHELGHQAAERMEGLGHSLGDLDVAVSTGRVVDFRAKPYLRPEPGPDTAPLIYPGHCRDGVVEWPKAGSKKPNALLMRPEMDALLVPAGTYVLVRRFSAKEERRRVVATVCDPEHVPGDRIGFENHLNYYHRRGSGLPRELAWGLAAFLNSSVVDEYFRQFNGHTQVNATDLRSLRYPAPQHLERLGAMVCGELPDQVTLDRLVDTELFGMAEDNSEVDSTKARARIEEALDILKALGLPRAQQNDRSALTLLALVDLKPDQPWTEASDPLRGITPMMQFFERYYGERRAPNTRETVRRFTVHQFEDAGRVVANPDNPTRPPNSPDYVYQIEPSTLGLLRTYGTPEWDAALQTILASTETLKARYAQIRSMRRIPVTIGPEHTLALSPGGQNVLIKQIIDEFGSRFTPGGKVIYVGDTDEKFAYFDEPYLAALGVTVDAHGKMPDVIIHHVKENWLVLIEAVISHGPVNPKRRIELEEEVFKGSTAPLVFVTAFLDRRAMTRYLPELAWKTEVWVAGAPDRLIHFDGERFLGPY